MLPKVAVCIHMALKLPKKVDVKYKGPVQSTTGGVPLQGHVVAVGVLDAAPWNDFHRRAWSNKLA